MVEIAERVWRTWRAESEEFDEPTILLLLSPLGDADLTLRAVAESVRELAAAYEAALQRGEEGPFPGEWDWVRVPDGVLVQVSECDDLEVMLRTVAGGLARRGVEGTMDIHDWPKVARPPIAAPLLECRLRVRGERVHRESIFFKWRPDPQALDAGAAGAARWCGRHRLSASLVLSADVAPDVPVDPHVDLAAHLRKTVTEHLRTALFAVRPDRFRIASVHSEDGRLSLVDGGASVEGDWWREALAELTGVLREHADVVVYGFIKRGSAVTAAWLDRSLTRDWPPRPDIKLLTAEVRGAAFQDAYAPDAFGVQLLGPGYAGRIPEGPEWRRERVGDGAVLLEHVDLESWFAHPFGSPESIAAGMPTPPVLMRARTELAPILFTEDVLRQASEDAADIHGPASS